jgi:hypothetical protein
MPTKKLPSSNKGLTVRVNLWSLESYMDEFDALRARMWVRGQVTNEQTGETKMFNDGGELLSTLGKWNATQLAVLKSERKAAVAKKP